MPDVTITGTIKVKNTTRTPGFIYAFPMSDFYIGTVPLQSSSPFDGGLPYKVVAVGAGAAGTGDDVGTMLYTVSIILPPTETATVNPDGARWGLFVFDNATVPQLISEVSGLASARVPVTTPTTLSALALYNGGSLDPVVVNVAISGTLSVAGVATFNANVIAASINGQAPIGGVGTANAYPLFTDADTLGNGYLKQESNAITVDGTAGSAELRLMTNGLAGATDRTLGVLYADPNVIELTARRAGTFAAQVTAIRLNALGVGSLIQFYRDGVNLWSIDGDGHIVPNGAKNIGTAASPVTTLAMGGNVAFYVASALQAAISNPSVDTLSFDNSTTGFARLRYGAGLYLQSGAGSPEGVVTAGIGSLYSRTNGGAGTSLYVKESGVGNTGWIAK